jgi:hypothetical protein
MRVLKIGDQVCWSQAFCSSIGDYSKSTADRRGTITAVGETDKCLARVKWDDGPEHWSKIENLWDATRRHLEPR